MGLFVAGIGAYLAVSHRIVTPGSGWWARR